MIAAHLNRKRYLTFDFSSDKKCSHMLCMSIASYHIVVAEFYENGLRGQMPDEVCELRSPPLGTGSMFGLTADCGVDPLTGTFEVFCDCCTSCI